MIGEPFGTKGFGRLMDDPSEESGIDLGGRRNSSGKATAVDGGTVGGGEVVGSKPGATLDEKMRLMEERYADTIHNAIVGSGFHEVLQTLGLYELGDLLSVLMFSPKYKPRNSVSAHVRGAMRKTPFIGDFFGRDGAFRDFPEYAQRREELIGELRIEIRKRVEAYDYR